MYSETERKFIEDNIVGLRASDFAFNDYAAYIRQDGTFGLISKAGKIKMGADGKPLVATYIDPFIETKARVYIGGKMKYQNFAAMHPNFIGALHEVVKPFNFKYKNTLVNCLMRLEGGKWAYLNTKGELETEPIFTVAHQFSGGLAICENDSGVGMINLEMDTVLGFRFLEIKSLGFGVSDSVLLAARKNMTPVYINKNGDALNEMNIYERVGQFSDGLALASKGGKFGYLNTNLRDSIAFEYEYARPFQDGLAAVLKGKRWYFINTKGQTVIAAHPKVTDVGTMNSGLAWIKVGSVYGFMSKDNPLAIAPKYMEVTDFYNGTAAVLAKDMYGLINASGDYIMKPSLVHIAPFNEYGLAIYQKPGSKLYGLIDANGNFVSDTKFDFIGKFKNGYAKVKQGFSKGLMNSTGQIVLPIKYEEVGWYADGLIRVRPRYGKWQYINLKGEVVISGPYEQAMDFENGAAIVTPVTRGKQPRGILINKEGKTIYHTKKDETIEFYSEGVIGIKHTIIDENKEIKIHYTLLDSNKTPILGDFKSIEPFINGLAIIELKEGFGVIDRKSFYIVAPKYRKIARHSESLFRGIITKHYGLYSKKGENLVYPKYDFIDEYNSKLLRLQRDDEIGYLKKSLDEWIWE